MYCCASVLVLWNTSIDTADCETAGLTASYTFIHGFCEGVPQPQVVLFETEHKVLQHLETKAFTALIFSDKYGIHHRELIASGWETITWAAWKTKNNHAPEDIFRKGLGKRAEQIIDHIWTKPAFRVQQSLHSGQNNWTESRNSAEWFCSKKCHQSSS